MINLQVKVTDERIQITEDNGIYYAEIVEENGDVFELYRAFSVQEMREALRGMGYIAN